MKRKLQTALSFLLLAGSTAFALPLPRVPPRPNPVPVPPIEIPTRPNVPLVLSGNGGIVGKLMPTAGVKLSRFYTAPAGSSTSGYRLAGTSDGRELFALLPGYIPMRYNALAGEFDMLEPRSQLAGTVDIAYGNNILYGVKCQEQVVYRFDMVGQQYYSFSLAGRLERDGDCAENIALGQDGKIYVASRYQVLRMDDIFGTNLVSYGTYGSGNGEFNYIRGIAVDSQGLVVASDYFNNRVVRFAFGQPRWDVFATGIETPEGVSVDSFRRVYVAVPTRDQVVRIDNFARGANTIFSFQRSSADRDDYLPGPYDILAMDPEGVPTPGPR